MQRLRAVFLRPIPVAAGAMIPGTVTAAAAAAVFFDESSSFNMNVCYNKIIY